MARHALGLQHSGGKETISIQKRESTSRAEAKPSNVAGWVSWEVAGIYLKRFTPWLLSRIVRRMKFSVHASR